MGERWNSTNCLNRNTEPRVSDPAASGTLTVVAFCREVT